MRQFLCSSGFFFLWKSYIWAETWKIGMKQPSENLKKEPSSQKGGGEDNANTSSQKWTWQVLGTEGRPMYLEHNGREKNERLKSEKKVSRSLKVRASSFAFILILIKSHCWVLSKCTIQSYLIFTISLRLSVENGLWGHVSGNKR